MYNQLHLQFGKEYRIIMFIKAITDMNTNIIGTKNISDMCEIFVYIQ